MKTLDFMSDFGEMLSLAVNGSVRCGSRNAARNGKGGGGRGGGCLGTGWRSQGRSHVADVKCKRKMNGLRRIIYSKIFICLFII